jgi:hypothetical protein
LSFLDKPQPMVQLLNHGEIDCVTCHGSDSASTDKATAHAGLDPLPSLNNSKKACGDCNEERRSDRHELSKITVRGQGS